MLEPIDRSTEEQLSDHIDRSELEEHLAAFEGLERTAGSQDDWEASRYIVDTLTEYGVDATLHEHEAYVSVPQSAGVTVTTPTDNAMDAITVSFSSSTPPDGVHGEVVPFEATTENAGARSGLEDRIVFVSELPKPHIVTELDDAGAAGIIFQSPNEHLYQGIVTPVWGTPSTDTIAAVPSIPVVEVNQADGQWLVDRLEHGPVEATLYTTVTTELRTLPCPVGTIDGRESERYFLVGNHVDSWFEGMTDNATAMAATLELARIFARHDDQLHRGIVFGFWSGHSTGRYAGSAWYADTNWLDLRANGVAYLHIDLPGLDGADSIWYQHMSELEKEHLDAIGTATEFAAREQEETYLGKTGRPARNSDQSFWGTGLSSLLSGARLDAGTDHGGPIGGGWWWHTPEDTRDKVDLDVLVEETKLYLALSSRMCLSPVLPHDYRATVEDIRTILSEIETDAEGAVTFDGSFRDLETLATALEDAYDVIEDRAGSDSELDTAIEDLQVAIGNELIPALYLSVSDYEHEPRQPYRPLPALRISESLPERSGRERRFAETTLQRGRIKLRHRIHRATAEVEQFLEHYQ